MRIAYLCNRYPAVSLTFIQREVRALRGLGMEVDTLAIRPAFADQLLSNADREEFASTYAVLSAGPKALLAAHLAAVALRPGRYLATLILALRLRPRGIRGAVWQFFYFLEAMLVWRQCHKRRIGHVHAQFANVATDVALLAAHFGGGRHGDWSWSFTLHGPVEFYDISQSRLPEKLSRAKFVVCISDFARSQAMAFLDQHHWDKLHVVHCGVDPSIFLSGGGGGGSSATDRIRLLNVGRLVAFKGQAVLLAAVAALRDDGQDVGLTIVGDGPDRKQLEVLAAQLAITDAVSFAGAVGQDEIMRFYESADVFCLPSFAEGVPVVLMEAMAMSVPVVATAIAGISELVDHGRSGLIVSPGRPDQLAGALQALAPNPELRRRMGAAGRERVCAEFDVRRSAQMLCEIFTAELGASASKTASGDSICDPLAAPVAP